MLKIAQLGQFYLLKAAVSKPFATRAKVKELTALKGHKKLISKQICYFFYLFSKTLNMQYFNEAV